MTALNSVSAVADHRDKKVPTIRLIPICQLSCTAKSNQRVIVRKVAEDWDIILSKKRNSAEFGSQKPEGH